MNIGFVLVAVALALGFVLALLSFAQFVDRVVPDPSAQYRGRRYLQKAIWDLLGFYACLHVPHYLWAQEATFTPGAHPVIELWRAQELYSIGLFASTILFALLAGYLGALYVRWAYVNAPRDVETA